MPARGLPEYTYNPKVCRFKTWLLNLTSWRIKDQLRRRDLVASQKCQEQNNFDDRTATIEGSPDPNLPGFGGEWDSAWERICWTGLSTGCASAFPSGISKSLI
ncbi:MAG TPA: hypothetical protein VGR78_12080 [Verrucomicrobiae bacterium]|jgi:hypothetical protein|nr:hypothetical protein [Verrucomicrobiae bacterium]